MTNRLHNLQQEQERLKQALADDPRWQLLVQSGRSNGAGVRLEDLQSDAVGDLAENESFAAYITVTRTIDDMQASRAKAHLDEPTEGSTDHGQPFRTRVSIKPKSIASKTPSSEFRDCGDRYPEARNAEAREDDLTAIRGIDRKLAHALNELGVYSYQTIADWDRYEVRRVRDALGLSKHIWRENWIEQAALLRMRQLSEPATVDVVAEADPLSAPVPAPETAPEAEATVEQSVALPLVVATAAGEPSEGRASDQALLPSEQNAEDDYASALPEFLTAIGIVEPDLEPAEPSAATDQPSNMIIKVGRRPRRLPAPAARRFAYLSGVSDEMAEALRSAGVKSLADIASWTRADVKWFRAILGETARVSQDQWIEQATLLSRGIWTKYALRVVRGETRAIVAAPEALRAGEPAMRVDTLPPIDNETTDIASDARLPDVVEGASRIEASREVDHADVSSRASPEKTEDTSVEIRTGSVAINTPSNELAAVRAKLPPTAQFDPMRGLTTAIALGKLRRPPPDLVATKTASRQQARSETFSSSSEALNEPIAGAVSDAGESRTDYASAVGNIGFDAIPPVRLEAPPEPVERTDPVSLSGAADWDDAEALVVKKKGDNSAAASDDALAEPEALPAEPGPIAAFPEPDTFAPIGKATDGRDEVVDPSEGEWDDRTADNVLWGSEADVVIVSKPRTTNGSKVVEERPRPESATERARKRLGIASRADVSPSQGAATIGDDDGELRHTSFSDAAEEATVTIIRAEASEERASSIVPHDIANDVAGPEQRAPKPRGRAIGSRFLKALTGE